MLFLYTTYTSFGVIIAAIVMMKISHNKLRLYSTVSPYKTNYTQNNITYIKAAELCLVRAGH